MEDTIIVLQKAILDLHGCKAIWVESVPVKETFKRETVWEGIVQVFDLQKHPTAKRCYAWSHGLDNSPQAAVRATIIAESKQIHINGGQKQ
jgi:hypothetical protein